MEQQKNKISISEEGKLIIQTDNAMCIDGNVTTDIRSKIFEISGTDVLILQAMLSEKKVSCIVKRGPLYYDSYIIIGENADYKKAIEDNIQMGNLIREFNNSRHWWERKIEI